MLVETPVLMTKTFTLPSMEGGKNKGKKKCIVPCELFTDPKLFRLDDKMKAATNTITIYVDAH